MTLLPIPTPPATTSAPVVELLDSLSSVILTLLVFLTSPLNVTGPSNCERIRPELPPSTTILSLTVTSSNTTLNLEGSSPVTVGIGVSIVVSSPVADDFFWFPI